MGEQISVPTGDGATIQWNIVPGTPPTTHFSRIDESWALPSTADHVWETVNFQQDWWTFPADGPVSMVTVHTVHWDFYLNTADLAQVPGLALNMFLGGVFLTNGVWRIDTGGTWQKRRFTFTGLSLTKAQYNTLSIQVVTVPGDPGWPEPEVVP